MLSNVDHDYHGLSTLQLVLFLKKTDAYILGLNGQMYLIQVKK